jgi:hypothetical protein
MPFTLTSSHGISAKTSQYDGFLYVISKELPINYKLDLHMFDLLISTR